MQGEEASISLARDPGEIARLGEWVAAFCERSRLGGKAEFELNLALEELVTNAIGHGQSSRVDVTLRVDGAELAAEIVDDGTAFDPTAAAPPNLAGDIVERKIGGLGIHLVRHLVRDLGFERRGDRNFVSFRMTTG